MKPLFLNWNEENALKKICQTLKENKLVLGTTDTVLGLFSSVTTEGFEALNTAKNRSKKPYLILIGSLDRINFYTNDKKSLHIENIAKRFWPGPLTIIFNADPQIPDFMKSADGTIALRMPNHSDIQALLKCSGDLFSTSANRAGAPIPKMFEEIDPLILGAVDYCVSGGDNKVVPSTIIDCTDPEDIKVIREGAISKEALMDVKS